METSRELSNLKASITRRLRADPRRIFVIAGTDARIAVPYSTEFGDLLGYAVKIIKQPYGTRPGVIENVFPASWFVDLAADQEVA